MLFLLMIAVSVFTYIIVELFVPYFWFWARGTELGPAVSKMGIPQIKFHSPDATDPNFLSNKYLAQYSPFSLPTFCGLF